MNGKHVEMFERITSDITSGRAVVWTDKQALGALRNGTLIEKCGTLPGDSHKDGALGNVLGSIGPIEFAGRNNVYGYFIEYHDAPGIPVATTSHRIRPVSVS